LTIAALFIGTDIGWRRVLPIVENENSSAGDEFGEVGTESALVEGFVKATLGGRCCRGGMVIFGFGFGEGGTGGDGVGMSARWDGDVAEGWSGAIDGG
jgi:hypothetical protein